MITKLPEIYIQLIQQVDEAQDNRLGLEIPNPETIQNHQGIIKTKKFSFLFTKLF